MNKRNFISVGWVTATLAVSSSCFTLLRPFHRTTTPSVARNQKPPAAFGPPKLSGTSRTSSSSSSTTQLWDGRGVATNYSWAETAYEMEVFLKVPTKTRARDIRFDGKTKTLDLKLMHPNGTVAKVLLDGTRKVRGKISMDGTFWGLSDDADGTAKDRTITVSVEKRHRAVANEYDIIQYDWGGLYPNDDEEVSERVYKEPEELDVKEYAAKMGVDIDNINMSWVDKDMFSFKNMTKKTMNKMMKQGLLREDDNEGDIEEFSVDKDGIKESKKKSGPKMGDGGDGDGTKIPFVDTDSPWGKTVPVERNKDGDVILPEHAKKQIEAYAAKKEEELKNTKQPDGKKKKEYGNKKLHPFGDPIDSLTVKRLQAILKREGLKVSGKKDELKARLRGHVESLRVAKQKDSQREESLQD